MSAKGVDTKIFRRSTAFSRLLRRGLRTFALPAFGREHRDAYAEQFEDASRNVEVAVEGTLQLVNRHFLKAMPILGGVGNWLTTYFGAQENAEDRDRYLVYTEHDHRIPFRPDQDVLYAYMVCQIAYLANELAEVLSRKEMKAFAGGFTALNEVGAEAFRAHPSVMPRFLGHDRLALRVVQRLDRPLNCCPSLHIAYALLLDNLARTLGDRTDALREALDSVRSVTLGMFNSVLYTKQHSLLDVAFGILCARIVFEERYEGVFDDLTRALPAMAADHPIPYDEIVTIYRSAWAMRGETEPLAETLGRYLQQHGYRTVPPDEDVAGAYFDTRARAIVRVHED